MAITQVTNPTGAYANVTDFRTGRDADGFDIQFGQIESYILRADGTIVKGDALMFVAPTATVPVSVAQMTAAASAALFAGAALHAAVVGEPVQFVRRGFVIVNIGADVPAAGQFLLSPDTTTGAFESAPIPGIGNQIVGVALGPEIGTSGLVFGFLDPTLSVEEV